MTPPGAPPSRVACRRATGRAGLLLVGLAVLAPADAGAQTTRVSRSAAGGPALGGHSGRSAVAISGDGRFVAFESAATNLVPGDTNDLADVFVFDRHTATTTRASVGPGGVEAIGGPSGQRGVALSGDGRFVAFESAATNLVAGDTNGLSDVFVHDRATGSTTRVSVASDGSQAQGPSGTRTQRPALSADGRYVAFASDAANLVAGDTNGVSDVFVHDRLTGETTRASVATGGAQAAGDTLGSGGASLSADGRFVCFVSDAGNLVADDTNGFLDAFVHDRATGETTRVSVRSGGAQATGADSFNAHISADGRFVAFDSEALVVIPDTNGDRDIFVHDRETGLTERVSVATGGGEATGAFGSRRPSISGDGRYVTFSSDATNLVAGDTNGHDDVFLHDRLTGRTTRTSVSSAAGQANGFSSLAAISADGRVVAFASGATNLVSGDTNALDDVFVRDTRMFLRTRVSVASDGGQLSRPSLGRPAISGLGRYIAFATDAPGVVPDDQNGAADVFVRDVVAKATTRVSVATDGDEGGGGSTEPAMSASGLLVAFESTASGLVPGDANGQPDIFLHDRATTTTRRVSVASGGAEAGGASRLPAVSPNGNVVAFVSRAPNLVPGDTNGNWDVFVHDRTNGRTTRVNLGPGGQQSAGDRVPGRPSLSGDGRLVAFASAAPDLVAGQTSRHAGIYVHDRDTGRTTRVDGREGRALRRHGAARDPAISADGRFVAFAIDVAPPWPFRLAPARRDIALHDRVSGTPRVIIPPRGTAGLPAVDADASHVTYDLAVGWFSSGPRHVFVHGDVGAAAAQVDMGEDSADGAEGMASVLGDNARVVAYRSRASTIVPDDTNGVDDMFVRATTPVVRDVSPRSGPAAGGTVLEIVGEGFTEGTTVSIGGVPATSVTVLDATRLDAVTPPHTAGLVEVEVGVPGFAVERLWFAFTYQP